MRKRYKKKLHSCAICKPHKMHGAKRWKIKEEVLLKEFEKKRPEDHEEDYKHAEQGCS